ncbi:hypothetical protein [Sulfurimonas sp.]|uniref:hypothetical protein n=1 Tax=Sulfurimonas sp. TaxID=2022749 RepID=UPI002B469390|nr:hypothetical protein [Sulfurimonas sp.]
MFISIIFSSFSFADVEYKSYLGYEYKSYLKSDDTKKGFNSAITFQNEFKYSFDDSKIYSKVDVLKDFEEEERDYFNITELYLSQSFDAFDLYFGKKVIFLGSLEANNIVDIFNRQNYKKDSLSTYKDGAYMGGINYYFEDDSILNIYIKGFEKDVQFSSKNSPYYPFKNTNYDKDLLFANGSESPSILSTYSKSYDEDIIADISYGFFYGYDGNILYKRENNTYQAMLFQSMKIFTYDTFVVDSMLFKVEASYTKVQDDGDFEIKDFYEFGMGAEYTIVRFIDNHNLGLISEYYKSDSSFTSFENDIFLALRYSLNDKDSSELLLGLSKDMKTNEKSSYLKYSGRLTDSLNISIDVQYMQTNSFLNEHLRVGCEIKYYF